jgi:hypothetical protein
VNDHLRVAVGGFLGAVIGSAGWLSTCACHESRATRNGLALELALLEQWWQRGILAEELDWAKRYLILPGVRAWRLDGSNPVSEPPDLALTDRYVVAKVPPSGQRQHSEYDVALGRRRTIVERRAELPPPHPSVLADVDALWTLRREEREGPESMSQLYR